MKVSRENDGFVLTKPVVGKVIGEGREMALPSGTDV
jgi:hypothetical protein